MVMVLKAELWYGRVPLLIFSLDTLESCMDVEIFSVIQYLVTNGFLFAVCMYRKFVNKHVQFVHSDRSIIQAILMTNIIKPSS